MMLVNTLAVQVIYALATVLSSVFAVILWRNRETRGAIPLGITAVGIGLWAGSLLIRTVTGRALARPFIALMYLGVVVTVPAVFVFALEYTGRERYVNRRTLGLLSVHPVVTMFFIAVDPNDWFFGALVASSRPAGYAYHGGPLFGVHLLYSYVLILGTVLLILAFVVRANRTLYRGQAIALVLAVLTPLPLNAVFVLTDINFDLTAVGFVVTFSFLTVATVRYDLINVAPIAREKVLENVRDGIVVVDTEDRVVDSNPAGRRMLGFDEAESLIGERLQDVLAEFPEMVSDYEAITAESGMTERTVSYGDLYLTVQATPLEDDLDRHVGWVVLFEDVTERKRRERDLEGQIEKLDQFASLVSHDLRNPLNVARGYVQQARATGDLDHLEKTEEAMERMEAIIEDALTLAREGQDVTEPVDVSLADVAREAWDHVETGRATLAVEADETIVADRDRLQRLFENLFRNAVEHGLPDGKDDASRGDGDDPLSVTVGVTDQIATELTFFVADDGVGIPDEDNDTVFESGYSTTKQGTGLGLSIVEQIASAHGWELAVEHSEDGGARIEISGAGRVTSMS